jgi:sugar lactone lactonase YvrE
MRTPSGARFAPVGLQIDRGVVWAVALDGALRIDPRRNVPDRYVPLAGKAGDPRGVVIDGDGIWVLTAAGRLRQYDARTGRVDREVRVRAPGALYLFWGPPATLTLLTAKNQLALLERASGRVLWQAAFGEDVGWSLFDDRVLWVQFADPATSIPSASSIEAGRLARVDADSGRRLGEIDLPERGVAGMAKVGRDLWVATPDGRIVVVR